MDDVLAQIERQLVGAIRGRVAARRRRRRVVIAVAVALALPAAVAGASVVSGRGPIARVLGVEDDLTLRVVGERPGAPRGVARMRGDDGHLYTFAAFHAKRGWAGGPSVCSTAARDDAEEIEGLGCEQPASLARRLREDGIVGGFLWGGMQLGGLRVTRLAAGLVPVDARSLTFARPGGERVEAKLSKPFPVSLRLETRPARTRAFIAVATHDEDGATWLGGPITETATVTFADGSTKRIEFDDIPFFPMEATSPESIRPGPTRIAMRFDARPAPWRSVGFLSSHRTVCNYAAPTGGKAIRLGLSQCSTPLAVVNALTRYGAAAYDSDPNPRRERGPRSQAVFGFTRADAAEVTIVNQRGRRYESKLSRPWAVVTRDRDDLAGLEGDLIDRLRLLPRSMRIRSFLTSIRLPPRITDGEGVTLEVRLKGGEVLRTRASGPVGR